MKKYIICIATVCLMHVSGHAAQTSLENDELKKTTDRTRIVLIEPDIELERVLASGATETRADWSEQGIQNSSHWIKTYFSQNNIDFQTYSIPDGIAHNKQRQVRALHRAVGMSILNNQTVPLPTKSKFDWTLGNGAQSLSINDADYGLFLFVRRGYGTGGRVALSVASAVLFGAAPLISYQFAFASLVDLQTGQIVWFNDLKQVVGDLREQDGAQRTIVTLLRDFPQLELPELKRPKNPGN